MGANGMTNRQEVKVQTRGPDEGNPTPKRQGPCCVIPRLSQREANAARPAMGGLVEVIGAWPSKRKRSVVRRLQRVSRPTAVKPSFRQSCQAYWHHDGHEACWILPVEVCRVPRKR